MKANLIAMLALTGLAAAAPKVDQGQGRVLSSRDLGEIGVLINYERDTSAVEERNVLSRRCGSNQVSCSGSNTSDKGTCQNLINQIRGSNSQISGTSICLRSTQTCCISWDGTSGPFPRGDLYSAAQATLNQCSNGNSVSGYAVDVNLNGACVHQCLSDRDNGC